MTLHYEDEKELLENSDSGTLNRNPDLNASYRSVTLEEELKQSGIPMSYLTMKRPPDIATAKNKGMKAPGGTIYHPKPKISHKEFQGQVVQLAKQKGWKVQYWWKSYHSPSGFPDLFMCRPPRIVIAELKVGKDKLSPEQAEWGVALTNCGETWFCWYPEDWDAIVKILE